MNEELVRIEAKKIRQLLKLALEERGWNDEVPPTLGSVFCKKEEVTAYFDAHISSRRQKKHFRIGGAIGVIHRDFERMWANSHKYEELTEKNGFCLWLLIDNFPQMDLPSYIFEDSYKDDIELFSNQIVALLENFPSNERDLKLEIDQGGLCGRPLDSFVTITSVGRTKYEALARFLRR